MRASLALKLLPSEFLLRATPLDLSILQDYDARFLLGDIRDDRNTALWCSTYINSKLKPSASAIKLTEFMPQWVKGEAQSQKTMAAMLRAWAKANGAVIPPGK